MKIAASQQGVSVMTNRVKTNKTEVRLSTIEHATANSVSFVLPFCPPSVNSLYIVKYKEPNPANRVQLRDECRQWVTSASVYVPRFRIADSSIVRIDWTVTYKWLSARGAWVKRDTSNMLKLLHDMISKKTGIDDRRFKCGMMSSVNGQVERTEVTLTEVTMGEWSAAV